MKILITGTIGSILAPELDGDHEVYGVDIRPSEWANSTQSDLCDPTALPPIFEGMEMVIHLAADPRHEVEIGWDVLTNPNLIATARMYDAAHDAGVRRVIFASSMHVAHE
ncbi:NAD(P)-dependent oxidoreductase [Chloroflexi bacterium TSY]|nr:NAD(P)-dependent oxidoreductase [Chloroflexi bacterium TSY]